MTLSTHYDTSEDHLFLNQAIRESRFCSFQLATSSFHFTINDSADASHGSALHTSSRHHVALYGHDAIVGHHSTLAVHDAALVRCRCQHAWFCVLPCQTV